MFLNPFSELIEDKRYPFSRILRTSFLQKLSDSFHVIAGSQFYSGASKLHVGLFDYLTLFTSTAMLAFLALAMWMGSSERKVVYIIGTLLVVPLLLVNFPLLAARYLVSGMLTIVVSPITLIVHWIANAAVEKDKRLVKELKGTDEDGNEVRVNDHFDLFEASELERGGFPLVKIFKLDIRHVHNMQQEMSDEKTYSPSLLSESERRWPSSSEHFSTTSTHKYLFFPRLRVDVIGDCDGIKRVPLKIDLNTQAPAFEACRKLNIRNILVNENQGDVVENSIAEDSVVSRLITGMY